MHSQRWPRMALCICACGLALHLLEIVWGQKKMLDTDLTAQLGGPTKKQSINQTYDCRPSGLEGWVSPMAVAFQVCIIDVFNAPNLYMAVKLRDCWWPHMQKCTGTFEIDRVPLGPAALGHGLHWSRSQHKVTCKARVRPQMGHEP